MTEAGRVCGEIVMVFFKEKLVKEIFQELLFRDRNMIVIFRSGNCGIFAGIGGGIIGMFENGRTV